MTASAPASPAPSATGRRLWWIVFAALLAVGLWRAAVLAWLCDDSFISIRYAENLADGLGLVYNAGERVEGYTNLLWTLLLAAAAWAGASPVSTAKLLGIACYAALARRISEPPLSDRGLESEFFAKYTKPTRGRASFVRLFPRVAPLWMTIVLGNRRADTRDIAASD